VGGLAEQAQMFINHNLSLFVIAHRQVERPRATKVCLVNSGAR